MLLSGDGVGKQCTNVSTTPILRITHRMKNDGLHQGSESGVRAPRAAARCVPAAGGGHGHESPAAV